MARRIILGDKKIEDMLKGFADKTADKFARNALSAGLTVLRKAIKQAAPVGPTGTLKASIGARIVKGKRGYTVTGKAGINVGKRPRNAKRKKRTAPHGHLVGLGTKARQRKAIGGKYAYIKNPTDDQLSTGTMPANDFVRRATQGALSAIRSAQVKAVNRAIAREAERVRKKGNR